MTTITRTFQQSDLNGLRMLFIALQAYEQTLCPDRAAGEIIVDEYLADLQHDIAEKGGAITVAEDEGQVVGFVAYHPSHDILNRNPHLYITDLIIADTHRNRGLAGQLMAAAEEYAREHNLPTIRVEVLANNPARHFYEHLQYQVETLELKKDLQ